MNEQKIDCQERIFQQSHHHGLLSDCNFEVVGNQSNPSQILGLQQPGWNMGIWVQKPSMDQGLTQPHQQLQNLGPTKSPSSIMSRFESPASAFYATERCMGFPQYDTQIEEANFNETYTSIDDHNDPSFDIRNTLQSIVKSQSQSQSPTYHPYHKSSHKSNQIPLLSTQQQIKLHGDNSLRTPSFASLPPKETQDQGMSFFSQQGKQSSPRIGSGNVSATYCDSPSTSPVLSNKTRIRWNQDLHEKFVGCVNRLGGADKATPKAILKMMGLDGLTIFHVKSHLQKYRIAKYLPDSAEGKLEKRTNTLTVEPQLDVKTGLQIKEALQLQLDVQRRLHEQLEIQRNLQMRIEEQGKQLKKMFDLQQQTGSNLLKTHNLDTPCHEDAPSNNLSDTQISTSQCSGNTNFPSKIS